MCEQQTILLTGATGFLGSHLLEALLEKGHKVIVLKRSTSNTWRIIHLLSKLKVYDIDTESIESIFREEKIDIIIHMATFYKKINNTEEISAMINTNITLPTKLLEIGIRHDIKAFINTGTFFEYDCSTLPVTEESNKKPFNFYAKTKLAFEEILKTYSNEIAINTFRIFSPYGEKDDDQKLIPTIMKSALSAKKLKLSEGFQKLDFIYAKDISNAYIHAIDRIKKENIKKEYHVFNLGTGQALSIREVVSIIEQSLKKNIEKEWGIKSNYDIPMAYASIDKSFLLLDWTPTYSIYDGISNTLRYYEGKI